MLFYLNLSCCCSRRLSTLVLPRRTILRWRSCGAASACGCCASSAERESSSAGWRISRGAPLIVAAKHQSTWETFALLRLFDDFTFIVKRELMWIPLFGWFMAKGRMIPVDRGARFAGADRDDGARRARKSRGGRQLIIFPEGTRRSPGAEPRYKFGVAHLYGEAGVPCVPVALNSGLFWPRRKFCGCPAPSWSNS